ncbi:hypothetical protein RHCRD62_50276 [Rhodococcus sp. RD6.2]|nr:hypothetical protein RHCRD62_50276 [Rhodococcus sp. RD6.2]
MTPFTLYAVGQLPLREVRRRTDVAHVLFDAVAIPTVAVQGIELCPDRYRSRSGHSYSK